MPVIYQPKISGRILYFFWSIFFCALGCFLLFVLMAVKQANQTWLVYVFVISVVVLWLYFSIVCMLKALKAGPRIVVTEKGFIYHGILKTQEFLWKSLVSVNHPRDRGGLRWLTVKVNQDANKIKAYKLDFTGLSPDHMDFITQVREFAPSAILKFYSSRI